MNNGIFFIMFLTGIVLISSASFIVKRDPFYSQNRSNSVSFTQANVRCDKGRYCFVEETSNRECLSAEAMQQRSCQQMEKKIILKYVRNIQIQNRLILAI